MRMRWCGPLGSAVLGLLVMVGCGQGSPAPTGSASVQAGATSTPPIALSQNPSGAPAASGVRTLPRPKRKADPIAEKTHHSERCLLGVITLAEGMAAYKASVGTAKPSAKKVPSFGLDRLKEGGSEAADKPAEPSGTRRRNEGLVFARTARSCNLAAAQKTPEDKQLDEALAEAVAFAPELGRVMAEAANYYALAEHEKDAFKKGLESHDLLVKEAAKLAPAEKKLSAALGAFKKAHPMQWESKPAILSTSLVEAGLAALAVEKAADLKPSLELLQKHLTELETEGQNLDRDPFVKSVVPAAKALIGALSGAKEEASPRFLMVTLVLAICEARFSAYQRELSGRIEPPPPMNFHDNHPK